jgi:hypothetical protein
MSFILMLNEETLRGRAMERQEDQEEQTTLEELSKKYP